MPIGDRRELQADCLENFLHPSVELLAVLQCARRVKRYPLRTVVHRHQRREAFPFVSDHFDRIARELTYRSRLVGVLRIVAQQVAVILDCHAAATRGDDNRLRALLDMRPPGIDVPARESRCFLARAEVFADSAAAPATWGTDQRNVHAIQHARQCRVDIRRQRWLYATSEREHLPRMTRRRPGSYRPRRRHLGRQRRRQKRSCQPSRAERESEQRGVAQALAQQPPPYALAHRPPHSLLEHPAPDIHQPAVAHAGGTDCFAAAASQTTVQMQLRLGRHVCPFEQLFDQIDTPARTVELVAEQLVRGTGRRTEPAMNARAENRVRVASIGAVPDEIGQIRFHAQNSVYMR